MEYQNRQNQMSERQIEREYSKVEIKPAEPNRVNCYVCAACGHVMKTIDVHHGVTPMFLTCDKCGDGSAASTFFNDVRPDIEPTYEWFVPTLQELKKYKRNPAMLDHIFRGGLDKRKIVKPAHIQESHHNFLIRSGYEKRQYGYVRDNKNGISQGVTLFDNNRVQLFGWYKRDDDGPKVYDSGIVSMPNFEQFATLVNVFNQFKNDCYNPDSE
jgi:hypothetical protein